MGEEMRRIRMGLRLLWLSGGVTAMWLVGGAGWPRCC